MIRAKNEYLSSSHSLISKTDTPCEVPAPVMPK